MQALREAGFIEADAGIVSFIYRDGVYHPETDDKGIAELIVLTCPTKQELSKGGSNETQEWYRHMRTIGVDRWDDYQRNLIKCWRIY